MEMAMIAEHSMIVLSFIAGPAIITNACCILQNGTAIRYSLAVAQWREFLASRVADDHRLDALFADPNRAVRLAERRIRLQLRQTRLLLIAACLFASTSLLALLSALGTQLGAETAATAMAIVMLVTGASGLLLMTVVTATFFLECACTGQMIALHPPMLENTLPIVETQ
jgi:hypothetical protein